MTKKERDTLKEAQRKGGRTTVERHGIKHMRKIGQKGGKRPRPPAYVEEPRD